MLTNEIIDNFMGFKVIDTEACCDYVQVRKHKKKRINKNKYRYTEEDYEKYLGTIV